MNILNDSFAQPSAMKILNEDSKDPSLFDQVAAIAPKLKSADPQRAIKAKPKA